MDRDFFLYMLASGYYGTLYIGVTNDLLRRVQEHRKSALPGFTADYKVHRLVWYESYGYVYEALAREKQLKHWRRKWKIELIEQFNPQWDDLYPALVGS